MTLQPKLDVIIVNWNAGPALRECLQSLAAAEQIGFELDRVMVVDNASDDSSAKDLNGLGLPLTIIQNHENRGFAAACNQGAQNSRAHYLLFLNPDTRVFAHTLAKSAQWMSYPDAKDTGILGVQLIGEDGEISRSCARFPRTSMFLAKMLGMSRFLGRFVPDHFYSEWDHKDSRHVDQVMGAYFLVRRKVFEQLRGFDERFFVYFEEVDFSLQARRAGWKTYFLASTRCFHRGCGTTDQVKAYRLFYSLQSRILFAFKNMGRVQACWLTIATLLIEPLSRILEGAIRLSPLRFSEVVHGYWLLYGSLPSIFRKAMGRVSAGRRYAALPLVEE